MHPLTDRKKWLAKHRASIEAVERIRLRELRDMTEEEALCRMMSLSIPGTPCHERHDCSGLVEQQAIFRRQRKQ